MVKSSEKYGVNPSIPRCFWCGEQKHEVVLFGKLPGDKKAPDGAVINYEPCDECKKNFKKGILIMEALKESNKPIPTGRHIVVSENFINNFVNDNGLIKIIKECRKTFTDVETFQEIIDKIQNLKENNQDEQ